jgi:ubiquinol-cytochrome c reductase cytochrome b subunit
VATFSSTTTSFLLIRCKLPLHIAPVWYFTPFYSMLRAITSEMMYALIACVLAGAAFGVFKAKMPAIVKPIIAGAALVVVALMLCH